MTSYFTSDQKANSYGTSLCRYIYYYGQDAKALGNVKLTKCQAVDATSSYYTVADGIPVAVQGTRGYKYKMDGQGPMRNKPVRSTVWPRCSRRMENG